MLLFLAAVAYATSPVLLVLEPGHLAPAHDELLSVLTKQGVSNPRVFPLGDLVSVSDAADRGAIRAAVEDAKNTDWSALTEAEWGQKAHQLRDLTERLVPATTEDVILLFGAYVQIGRTAENANNPTPPFFGQIGKDVANVYWYRAGALAHDDPSLLRKVSDADLRSSVDYYKGLVDKKTTPWTTLSFTDEGAFDPAALGRFRVYLNATEILVDDPAGQYPAPVGANFVRLDDAKGRVLQRRFDSVQAGVQEVLDARPHHGDLLDALRNVNKCDPLSMDPGLDKALGAWIERKGTQDAYLAFPPPGKVKKTVVVRYQPGSLVKTSCL